MATVQSRARHGKSGRGTWPLPIRDAPHGRRPKLTAARAASLSTLARSGDLAAPARVAPPPPFWSGAWRRHPSASPAVCASDPSPPLCAVGPADDKR